MRQRPSGLRKTQAPSARWFSCTTRRQGGPTRSTGGTPPSSSLVHPCLVMRSTSSSDSVTRYSWQHVPVAWQSQCCTTGSERIGKGMRGRSKEKRRSPPFHCSVTAHSRCATPSLGHGEAQQYGRRLDAPCDPPARDHPDDRQRAGEE